MPPLLLQAWSGSPLMTSLMLPHRLLHRVNMSTSIMVLRDGNCLKQGPYGLSGVTANDSVFIFLLWSCWCVRLLCYTGALPRIFRQIILYLVVWQFFNSFIDFGCIAAFFWKMRVGSEDFRLIPCPFCGYQWDTSSNSDLINMAIRAIKVKKK